jgi:hypothetical protein
VSPEATDYTDLTDQDQDQDQDQDRIRVQDKKIRVIRVIRGVSVNQIA